jgi:hypothetical protein
VSLSLSAALWSETRLRRLGAEAHHEIVIGSIAIAAVHVVLASVTMRRPYKDSGGQNFVFYSALTVPAVLAGHYYAGLSSRQRLTILGALGGVTALGWVFARRPLQPGQFLLALTWPFAAGVPGLRLDRELRQAAATLAERLDAEDETARQLARDRGVACVLDLVQKAYGDARAHWIAGRGALDSALDAEVERRLQEVGRRLDRLYRIDESSLSMTTRSFVPVSSPH